MPFDALVITKPISLHDHLAPIEKATWWADYNTGRNGMPSQTYEIVTLQVEATVEQRLPKFQAKNYGDHPK